MHVLGVEQSQHLDRVHILCTVLMLQPCINHLHEKKGFDARLSTPTDTLCKSCYNMHLVLLQHIEEQASVPHLQLASFPGLPTVHFLIACSAIKNWTVGRPGNEANVQLQSDISLWKMKLHEETTDELTRAVLATVAKKLQQERALLLPRAGFVFLDNCPQAKDNEGM